MSFTRKYKSVLVILLIIFTPKIYAQTGSQVCSLSGYTIFTINGIFNNETDAKRNSNALKYYFDDYHNNEKLIIDFLYNPTHVIGIGDIIDYIKQGFFDQKSDYDLIEILNTASQKLKTQKVLLVGHSQGNFYTNNFYEKVSGKEGGVPND